MATTHTTEDGEVESNTGWSMLAGTETKTKIIDALLDLPHTREFNKSELADIADVSRRSVVNHFDVLEEVGMITPVNNTSPQRYRVNNDSPVIEYLVKLDGAINNRGPNIED